MSSNEPLADLVQRVGAFTEAVGDLGEEVTGLSGEVKGLRKRAGRHAGWITLDIALSVATIALGFVLGGEVDSLEKTNERLERSVKNQCAQLAVFLGSYRPESRPPETRAEYERTFESLRFQFKDLGCDPATVTRPIPTPASAPPR